MRSFTFSIFDTTLLLTFNGWSTRSILMFGAAFDDDGVRIGELDFDVLLLNARKFAFESVFLGVFLHIEARGECSD